MKNKSLTTQKIPFYRDERIINIITQTSSVVIMIVLAISLYINFKQAADARGLAQ